ncbi:hypothetical protein GCM10028806_34780 [Spirosoma terrae]|uniref:Uncharacterized protein n=1 Tax=Spirosoma terrae TaxID=1968276 RepID=A0A6L9L9I8_9BACT|nr:hypothetical protein [Spirosoma terrae]NDU95791.1 hypothetical protein [Spirosoma terrae]
MPNYQSIEHRLSIDFPGYHLAHLDDDQLPPQSPNPLNPEQPFTRILDIGEDVVRIKVYEETNKGQMAKQVSWCVVTEYPPKPTI